MRRRGEAFSSNYSLDPSRSMGDIRNIEFVKAKNSKFPNVRAGVSQNWGMTNEKPGYMGDLPKGLQAILNLPGEVLTASMNARGRISAEERRQQEVEFQAQQATRDWNERVQQIRQPALRRGVNPSNPAVTRPTARPPLDSGNPPATPARSMRNPSNVNEWIGPVQDSAAFPPPRPPQQPAKRVAPVAPQSPPPPAAAAQPKKRGGGRKAKPKESDVPFESPPIIPAGNLGDIVSSAPPPMSAAEAAQMFKGANWKVGHAQQQANKSKKEK